MASQYIGYYGAATPIARLPLIISMAVATAVLPATAEAIGLENKDLLKNCKSVLSICCPSGSSNVSGNNDICSTYNEITLHFTGLYEWSLSITDTCSWNAVFHYLYCFLQYSSGIRKPYLPMIILGFGSLFDVALSLYLVPIYGINGAAIATTITAFVIMVSIVWKTLQIADVKLEFMDFGRILVATGIMGTILLLILS